MLAESKKEVSQVSAQRPLPNKPIFTGKPPAISPSFRDASSPVRDLAFINGYDQELPSVRVRVLEHVQLPNSIFAPIPPWINLGVVPAKTLLGFDKTIHLIGQEDDYQIDALTTNGRFTFMLAFHKTKDGSWKSSGTTTDGTGKIISTYKDK
jgi:hypothetical protein